MFNNNTFIAPPTTEKYNIRYNPYILNISHNKYCLYEYIVNSPDIMDLQTRGNIVNYWREVACEVTLHIQCCHLWNIIKIKMNTKMTLTSFMIHILPDISVKQQ